MIGSHARYPCTIVHGMLRSQIDVAEETFVTAPFNRREFLKTTTLAGVAATATGHLQAAPRVRSGGQTRRDLLG